MYHIFKIPPLTNSQVKTLNRFLWVSFTPLLALAVVLSVGLFLGEGVELAGFIIIILCLSYVLPLLGARKFMQRLEISVHDREQEVERQRIENKKFQVDAEQKEARYKRQLIAVQHQRHLSDFQTKIAAEELDKSKQLLARTEKMISIGNLAAGVAHEINNPIGFISSNLQTLRSYLLDIKKIINSQCQVVDSIFDRNVDTNVRCINAKRLFNQLDIRAIVEDTQELIDDSLEGSQQVKRIVSDLKNFSHKGNGEFIKADINGLINQVLSIAANEIKYKARVIKKLANLPLVICDSNRLGQVFLNLVINACQAIKENGTIRISTRANKTNVFVWVSDNGEGMELAIVRRIFEPFYTTKEVGDGTGLGLYVSKNIVESHGGRLSVDSKPGEGTSFIVNLPIAGPEQKVIHGKVA